MKVDTGCHSALDEFRKMSNIDSNKLADFMIGSDVLEYRRHLVEQLRNDPVFHEGRASAGASMADMRRLTQARMKRIIELRFGQMDTIPDQWWKRVVVSEVLGCYDWSLCVKISVVYDLPAHTIFSMGTDRHLPMLDDIANKRIPCCFALTEIGHGSDTRRIRTTATFKMAVDKNGALDGHFVLHTPDFLAAKCWAGGLGQTCTHAVVFAQLYTGCGSDSDGTSSSQCYGLHAFIVQLRCVNSHRPLPGVTVGDMGHKAGLNGLDNGFVMFNNYRVARENLLNKMADVSHDGRYISAVQDQTLRFAQALGALSVGRVSITSLSHTNLRSAVTIAIRYTAVRRQFSSGARHASDGHTDEETPVLQYPLTQWRLIPYLAAVYVWSALCYKLSLAYYQFVVKKVTDEASDAAQMLLIGAELHALSSATKPVAGWLARDAIQECREACGGHGYLSASRLADIRGDHDSNLTYEGDNNVLIQQLSNYLLRIAQHEEDPGSPLGSVDFLRRFRNVASPPPANAEVNVESLQFCIETFEWLVWFLLERTSCRFDHQMALCGGNSRRAKNHVQVYAARPLAIAFTELYALRAFSDKIATSNDAAHTEILRQLGALYGLWSLDKHFTSYLSQGGYLSGQQLTAVQEAVCSLCGQLSCHAVSLVDVFAPHDFLLNSALGNSDGKVYDRLLQSFLATPGCVERPEWWRMCTPSAGQI